MTDILALDVFFEHACSLEGRREYLLHANANYLWSIYSDMYHGRRRPDIQALGFTMENIAQLALRQQHKEEQAHLARIAERAAKTERTYYISGQWREIDPVVRLVVIRRAANVGGCEDCHQRLPLELHHLHYRTVGFELPHDLAALCHRCHEQRHLNDPELCWRDA